MKTWTLVIIEKKRKVLKQISRENIRIDHKHLDKKSAKETINPCYFTGRILKVAFTFELVSYHNNHASSKITITPKYLNWKHLS